MNILIVGGAGYVGGALTNILLTTEHHILVYDLLLYEETYRKNVPFVYGDIRDHKKLQPHLDWADVVIWLAALVGDPACSLNAELTEEINTQSVQYLRDNFKGRIIFMSTCSVYGAAENMLTEESSLNPLSLYAKTKLQSETILKDTNSVVLRLGTLYGVSDAFSRIRFDLVVNTLCMRAFMHGRISVFGGQQYRPLLHVRDVAAFIAQSLLSIKPGLYNLHSENLVINDIAEQMKRHFPQLNIEKSQTMFQDNRNYRVSSQKAVTQAHFTPKLTVEDGIVELKQLLEEGRIKDSFLNRFSNYLYLRPLLSEYDSPLGKMLKFNL